MSSVLRCPLVGTKKRIGLSMGSEGVSEASRAGQEGDRRRGDPERTREAILAAAREEVAENGVSGARVDAIAARTQTVKRMIYYYFGSKDGLYRAVLERAYGDIRTSE